MVVRYDDSYSGAWDDLVLNHSMNGNFLQTRRFLSYHPEGRFKDASILFLKGDQLVAVIPANEIDGGKTLIAHQGTTYGGLVVHRDYANSTNYDWIFEELLAYIKEMNYEHVEIRTHNWLYSPDEKHHELLDYYFQLNGFREQSEIGFYVGTKHLDDNFVNAFEKLKRRKLNKAIKSGLTFKKLETDEEVVQFYGVLEDNMKKFGTTPVHTLEELMEFRNSRLKDETSFYGVFHNNDMIAGSMVWNFCNKKVFHTQYLASRHDYLEYCPNEFLYTNLIRAARDEGYDYLSYGTASLEHGKVYNESLGMFKEGFNTDSYMNRCYIWERG